MKQSRLSRATTSVIQELESRMHLDASVSSGVLTVTGDSSANNITVIRSLDPGEQVVVTIDGVEQVFQKADVISLVVNASDGNDTVSIGSLQMDSRVVNGEAGDDVLITGKFSSTLNGGDGNDSLTGGYDGDRLDGGAGNDTLMGFGGSDLMLPGLGTDVVNGGSGANAVDYSDRTEDLSLTGDGIANDGAAGENDNLIHITGFETGSGDDFISSGDFTLDVNSGAGNDTITSGASRSFVDCGDGDDVFNGGSGSDSVRGGEGSDTLLGNGAGDSLQGDNGSDSIVGGSASDRLLGGRGDDTLLGGSGGDQLFGNNGSDLLEGGSEGDRLDGGLSPDTLRGQAGDDVIDGVDVGAPGVVPAGDVLSGGSGAFDELVYTRAGGVLTITTGDGIANDGLSGEGDNVGSDFERISTSNAPDFIDLTNDNGRHTVNGSGGDDTIIGGQGADTLKGDAGNDSITGGTGPDRLDGGDGDDELLAEDTEVDRLFGRSGTDTGQVDSGIDILNSVELI